MSIRIAILISGMPRSFMKYLWPFLKQLPDNFDFYISIPKNQHDKYWNCASDISDIVANPKVKALYIENILPDVSSHLSQREKNTIYQWYRLFMLAQRVPDSYDILVRCRPDIAIKQTLAEFTDYFRTPLRDQHIYIPEGHNLCAHDIVPPTLMDKCINDQFAFGTTAVMKGVYCCMFEHLVIRAGEPLISEHQLYSLFERFRITINRVPINYKLILSECNVITISGDSGSGKSTVSKLLNEVFPYDNTLLFETDRYHKWERGSANYSSYTHLHPYANHLDRLASDVFSLSIGEDIYTVDYDHTTGRFTTEERVPSSKFLLVCGLHTNYEANIREISDLKVFIDTEQTLKEYWKIRRDTGSRGVSAETVRQTIQRRMCDYEQYINPQQEYADIVIRYFPLFTDASFEEIGLSIILRGDIKNYIGAELLSLADTVESHASELRLTYCTPERLSCLHHPAYYLKDGYDGLLQYLFLCLLLTA